LYVSIVAASPPRLIHKALSAECVMPTNHEEISVLERYAPPADLLHTGWSLDALIGHAPERALVHGPYPLSAGWLSKLLSTFSIPDGFVAIARHGGRHRALLHGGRYSELIMPLRGRSDLLLVDMRERIFPVHTRQELSVDAPAGDGRRFTTRLNLNLDVHYQVRRPDLVVQYEQPLTELAAQVIDATGTACKRYEHLGSQAGRIILTTLRRRRIELLYGIEVLDIVVTHLQRVDTPHSSAPGSVPAVAWEETARRIRDEIRQLQQLLFVHSYEHIQHRQIIVEGLAYSDRGEQLRIEFVCGEHYPQQRPQMEVQLDAIPQGFPWLYANWTPDRTILDLARATIAMHEE
jgi:hypothetical protein